MDSNRAKELLGEVVRAWQIEVDTLHKKEGMGGVERMNFWQGFDDHISTWEKEEWESEEEQRDICNLTRIPKGLTREEIDEACLVCCFEGVWFTIPEDTTDEEVRNYWKSCLN